MGRVAVTGAGGFIGSHLVAELVGRGVDVVAIVRANGQGSIGNLAQLSDQDLGKIEIRHSDVMAPADLQRHLDGVDTVFHLAAQISVPYSKWAPSLFLQVNVMGTQNVLRAAHTLGIPRVVVMSTSEVYGAARQVPITEDHPLCARSPYAASKIAAEKLAEAYHYTYSMGTVIVRAFNTFGPRQSTRAVIPWLASQALSREVVRLGNIQPVRDFVFVRDTVHGIIAAGTAAGVDGQTFNLATGRGYSIAEIVDRVRLLTGRQFTVEVSANCTRNERFEVWKLIGSGDRAAARLGWTPSVGIDEGLRSVLNHVGAELQYAKR